MLTHRYFEGLTFKVASQDEREPALRLRSRIYLEELGDSGLDRFDDLALHLIALDNSSDQVIAALRLIRPEDRPFDIERFVDLNELLPPSRRPAEVSRFCVQREYRAVHRGQLVHLGMLKLLYEYGIRHAITDMITLGLSDLVDLYRAAFFTPLGPSFIHPTWGQAQGMRLDLVEIRRAKEHSRNPIARFLLHTSLPNLVVS